MNQIESSVIKKSAVEMLKLTLDRLTVCFTEPDQESVKKTVGLLQSDAITKYLPGIVVTQNARYFASCRFRLPGNPNDDDAKICFEAGPRRPGQPSYRLDYNPDKLSADGAAELMGLLGGWIMEDPTIFFYSGKITRCDAAIDCVGHRNDDVIIRARRLQKHGVYSNRYGVPETTYIGTPRGRRVVAYDKPNKLKSDTNLRLECRLKPGILGKELAKLPNPFAGIELLPADFSDAANLGIPAQFVADSCRIGGIKRPLKQLDPAKRNALKAAYEAAQSLIPNLDSLWATWPNVLIASGLGKELGAIPVTVYKDVHKNKAA